MSLFKKIITSKPLELPEDVASSELRAWEPPKKTKIQLHISAEEDTLVPGPLHFLKSYAMHEGIPVKAAALHLIWTHPKIMAVRQQADSGTQFVGIDGEPIK